MPIRCISIQNAMAGMILAKPAVDENGRTLCGENTTLSDKLIAQCVRNNVSGLYIITDEKISDEEFKKIKSKIESRFSKIPPDSLFQDLKNIIIERLEAKR